jgi:AbrB family looped-hinge helix DNA binding protein
LTNLRGCFTYLLIVRAKGGQMGITTISPKYQVVIPKEVREKLQLKKGQKMVVIAKGGIVHMIPEKPPAYFKGFLKGLKIMDFREDQDRI